MYRGGLHGETATSHDGEEKKIQRRFEVEDFEEAHEGQEGDTRSEARKITFEDRQSQPSNKSADESTQETDGGQRMTDTPATLPKTSGQFAKILGNLTNDPRITNLLMLVIIAVGMGVHESIQTQVCSL